MLNIFPCAVRYLCIISTGMPFPKNIPKYPIFSFECWFSLRVKALELIYFWSGVGNIWLTGYRVVEDPWSPVFCSTYMMRQNIGYLYYSDCRWCFKITQESVDWKRFLTCVLIISLLSDNTFCKYFLSLCAICIHTSSLHFVNNFNDSEIHLLQLF